MTKLYASHSSEFFAVREPGRVYVYRDSYLDQTHRVADHLAGDLIHLADNGDCFFRAKDGLFRLRREKGVRAERCKAVAGLDGSTEGGVLRGFTVRADGEQIAYEAVVPAQKFSSKLKRFLGQKSSQGDVGPSLHRFILSGWSGRSSSCYFETVIDPRTSAGLVWWTAPDFGFLAVLERERDGRSILRVIDVLHESVVSDLAVTGKLSRDRAVTTNGTVGFGQEKQGRRIFVIWTYSQELYQVAYPVESRVLHLTKDRVIFLNRSDHRLTVKTFRNEVVAEVSLSSLARMGVEYLVNFNPRGTIELVTYQNGKLRVQHTDIEQLPVDAKRWELVGEQRRAERIERETEELIAQRYERDDVYSYDERAQQLADEVETYASDNPFDPPVTRPPAVRESVPAPLGVEKLEPPPLPQEPLERPPEPAPPRQVDLPPRPQEPPPLPALRFDSKAQAQEALERLRMAYIAGEVNREDYYNHKTLIENALASFDRSEGSKPADGPPRRLSISTE